MSSKVTLTMRAAHLTAVQTRFPIIRTASAFTSEISPILVDILGDGFDLTDGAGGTNFDLNTDGHH
jgi:hypothetical protein